MTDLHLNEETQIEAVIKIAHGLHSRPVVKLAHIAKEHHCSIIIHYNNQVVSVDNLLDVLMLMIDNGETLKIVVQGPQSNKVAQLVKNYLENEKIVHSV